MTEPIYSEGAAAVAPGSPIVSISDAPGLATSAVRAGDQFKAQGRLATITADPISNTSLAITPWPGEDLVAAPGNYEIIRLSDANRLISATRLFMGNLVPNLAALGALVGAAGKIPMFSGVGAMTTIDRAELDPRIDPVSEKILALADIQPWKFRDGAETTNVAKWRSIRDGIATLHGSTTDWMILAGDIVHRGGPLPGEVGQPQYTFTDMDADLRPLMPRSRIFAIPGNHDWDYTTKKLTPYLDHWEASRFYVVRGNMLYIFLGDEVESVMGEVSDRTFYWWRRLVLEHPWMNIVTISHQPLTGTTAGSSTNDSWRIINGDRFIAVLNSVSNHVLWIHGHNEGITSPPYEGLTSPNTVSHVLAYNTWHVNVGFHLSQYLYPNVNTGNWPMSYCTLHLTRGGSNLQVRRWNVETNAEVVAKRFNAPLAYPCELSREPQFDGRRQESRRFPLPDAIGDRAVVHATKGGTAQTGIAASTYTKITFGTELYDPDNYFNPANSRFTPPPGRYIISAQIHFSGGLVDTSRGFLSLYKNGVSIHEPGIAFSGTAAQACALTVMVEANGTDYFEVFTWIDGAGNKTIGGDPSKTWLQAWEL